MDRRCTKCQLFKPFDDFYRHGNGWRSICKVCYTDANRQAYKGDRRQKKIDANKRHKQDNPDYYRNYHQDYYRKNKQNLLSKAADRYATAHGRAQALHTSAKDRATKRGWEFTLSFERVYYAILGGRCERSGVKFDLRSDEMTWRNPNAPSIDRKSSFDGYTNENVQIVITLYNYGKGQHTDDEFIAFCRAVADRNPA